MKPQAQMALGGRYRLVRQIAVGGMGEVWVAHDESLSRDVAVKVLREEFAGNADFLDRLRTEARNSAALSHANIAQLYDYGEQQGSGYLVMELVHGEPMSDLLEREPVLPILRLLSILSQTARALHAAHMAGVVHRDVKPGNILLERSGEVKITDFGVSLAANQIPMTAAGMVMGTAQYLSPEQAIGKAATGASDIYALGIVAYESVVGNRPFTGATPVDIAVAQVNEAVPPLPPTTHAGLADLIMRMLEKDPLDRPRSGAILARNFDLLADEIAADPWGAGIRRPEAIDVPPAQNPSALRVRPPASHLAADDGRSLREPPATTRESQRLAASNPNPPLRDRRSTLTPSAPIPAIAERRGRRSIPVPSDPVPIKVQEPAAPRRAAPPPAPQWEPVPGPPRYARAGGTPSADPTQTVRTRSDARRAAGPTRAEARSETPSNAARRSSSARAATPQRAANPPTSRRSARPAAKSPLSRIKALGWPTLALIGVLVIVLLATLVKALVGSNSAVGTDLSTPMIGAFSVQSTIGVTLDGMISGEQTPASPFRSSTEPKDT